MSNPGAKQFGQVQIVVDIWLDPEKADASMWALADSVQHSMWNACDSIAKELDAPDHGIEVCVR
jgi:hypothetical protein